MNYLTWGMVGPDLPTDEQPDPQKKQKTYSDTVNNLCHIRTHKRETYF